MVFLYTGQGSQYPGMGRALYQASPVYRDVIDRCDAALGPDAEGRTLQAVLHGATGEEGLIHQTAWTQPALFAVELALTELWRSWGIEPAAVIGHSVGEYVAACVAGVFTLEEGVRLIAERGRLMQALPPGGTMAAVFAPVEELARTGGAHGRPPRHRRRQRAGQRGDLRRGRRRRGAAGRAGARGRSRATGCSSRWPRIRRW